jgi:glutaredoxin
MIKKYTIEDMQKIAKARNGKCISSIFETTRAPLLWECQFGHRWKAIPSSIIYSKSWCPQCVPTKSGSIQEMKEFAKRKRGKCISDEYINAKTPLLWECEFGHRWKARPNSITFSKTWCPQCIPSKRIMFTMEDMQKIAASRGGACLSEAYIDSYTKLEWQCKMGHHWESTPQHVKQGNWCPYCAIIQSSENRKLKDDYIRRKIHQKGAKWIAGEYINNRSILQIQCNKGHLRDVSFKNLMDGRKCPDCLKLASELKIIVSDLS